MRDAVVSSIIFLMTVNVGTVSGTVVYLVIAAQAVLRPPHRQGPLFCCCSRSAKT